MITAKQALAIALIVVTVWVGLNAGRTFYYDWRFLHQARLLNDQVEAVRAAQAAQTPPQSAPAH